MYDHSLIFISFFAPFAFWLYYGDEAAVNFRPESLTIQLVNLVAILVTFGVVFPPLCIVVVVTALVETYYVQALMVQYVKMAATDEEEADRVNEMEAASQLMTETLASSLWLLLPLSASFNATFLFDILGDTEGWDVALWGLFIVALALPLALWTSFVVIRRFFITTPQLPSVTTPHSLHSLPPQQQSTITPPPVSGQEGVAVHPHLGSELSVRDPALSIACAPDVDWDRVSNVHLEMGYLNESFTSQHTRETLNPMLFYKEEK